MTKTISKVDYYENYLIHPLAKDYPMMDSLSFGALKEDIRKNGLRDPIIFLSPRGKDTKYKILDGRNRANAFFELFPDKEIQAVDAGLLEPGTFGIGLLIEDKEEVIRAFIASKNLHRRHLTKEQKDVILAKAIERNLPKAQAIVAAKKAGSLVDKSGPGRGKKTVNANSHSPFERNLTEMNANSLNGVLATLVNDDPEPKAVGITATQHTIRKMKPSKKAATKPPANPQPDKLADAREIGMDTKRRLRAAYPNDDERKAAREKVIKILNQD